MALISGLVSLVFGIFSIGFRLIIALIVGITMTAKGRNGLFWGLLALIFPFIIPVIYFIPAKIPKLPRQFANHPDFQGRNHVIASIMALSAIMAKTDGVVSREEISLIKQYLSRQFRISMEEIRTYEGAFNYGKAHPEDYQVFAELIRSYRRRDLQMAVGYMLMHLIMHDGAATEAELTMARKIYLSLGLSEYEFLSIQRYFMAGGPSAGYGQQRRYSRQSNFTSQVNLKEKYAKVLGVSPEADLATIKKAYRKLAKEYHPDKMASQGAPQDYMDYAHKRISEINEAYEYMKQYHQA